MGRDSPSLLDWRFVFDHHRDATIQVGHLKVPYPANNGSFLRALQMVGGVKVNQEFNLDRDLGINVQSANLFGLDLFRYWAGVWEKVIFLPRATSA